MSETPVLAVDLGYRVSFYADRIRIGCTYFSWEEIDSLLAALKQNKSHPLILKIGLTLIHHEKGVFPLSYVSKFELVYKEAKKVKETS